MKTKRMIYQKFQNLGFGKFKGKSIKEVMEIEPDYIVWCAINLDHFFIDELIYNDLISNTGVSLSNNTVNSLLKKCESIDQIYDDAYEDDHIVERDSYGKYSGTYAQDVEGYSDNFIDDVLDGEPDAYWNID